MKNDSTVIDRTGSNDGSNDGSWELLKSIARTDNRIRLIRNRKA